MWTLKHCIEQTKTPYTDLPCHKGKFRGSVQVFPKDHFRSFFYNLTDYRVSSAVSGPSYVMVPR